MNTEQLGCDNKVAHGTVGVQALFDEAQCEEIVYTDVRTGVVLEDGCAIYKRATYGIKVGLLLAI